MPPLATASWASLEITPELLYKAPLAKPVLVMVPVVVIPVKPVIPAVATNEPSRLRVKTVTPDAEAVRMAESPVSLKMAKAWPVTAPTVLKPALTVVKPLREIAPVPVPKVPVPLMAKLPELWV